MMELKLTNTEQTILESAEKIFIQKGFTGTRTTEIARAAGVNHALLHYYFRTKEALFERIFREKFTQMLDAFVETVDGNLSFFEKLKFIIEKHFDFIAENPGLPFFIIREVIQNDDRKKVFREKMAPIASEIIRRISFSVEKEIEKGTIRPIYPQDLLMNILSLNVFSFVAPQILFDGNDDEPSVMRRQFLEQRRKNNVETIINSIKI
ncbi:MAG: TetR/AcrR family transcriptional regulator [Dysgonamonadaceae bacterium]|jgi:AcrR family transcriptional regulator|nr:TetR/AcrR family transcriptional regulator [Dysgonamonadaceae bacterium]